MEIIRELPDEVILWRALLKKPTEASSLGYVVLDETEAADCPDNRAGIITFAGKTYRSIYYSKLVNRFTYYVLDKDDNILIKIVDSSVFDPKVVEFYQRDNNYTFVEGNDGYTYLVGGAVLYIISYGETEVKLSRSYISLGTTNSDALAVISKLAGGIKRSYCLSDRKVKF